MNWLIIYHRRRGALLSCDPYEDGQEALAGRFRLERDAHPDVEIVVLGADSLEDLKAMHGRYFLSMPELVARLGEDSARPLPECHT